MKKIIILLVLLFNLVPYYYEKGSLKTTGELFAQGPFGEEEEMITCRCPGSGVAKHPLGQCPCQMDDDEGDDGNNNGSSCQCCGGDCSGDFCSQSGRAKSDCAAECPCCGGTTCDNMGRVCMQTGGLWDNCEAGGGTCSCCGLQGRGCTAFICATNGKTIEECSRESCPCCGGLCPGSFCSLYNSPKDNCPGQGGYCNCCGSNQCVTPNNCGACAPCSCCGSTTCPNKNNCGQGSCAPCPCCGDPNCPEKGHCSSCASYDCNNTPNGLAYIDDCGNCVGGTTGRQACQPCCCGAYNCPKQGQSCGNCLCGDKHCTINNTVLCECCQKPHCNGCCISCSPIMDVEIVLEFSISQGTGQSDPKKKCEYENKIKELAQKLDNRMKAASGTSYRPVPIVVYVEKLGSIAKYENKTIYFSNSMFIQGFSEEDIISAIYHEYIHYLNDLDNKYPTAKDSEGKIIQFDTDEIITITPTPEEVEKELKEMIEVAMPSGLTDAQKNAMIEEFRKSLSKPISKVVRYAPSNLTLDELSAYNAQLEGETQGLYTLSEGLKQEIKDRIKIMEQIYQRRISYENRHNLNCDGTPKN